MKKDTTFTLLITLFFLIAGTFFSMMFFNKNLSIFTRASESQTVSAESSVILAWPINVPSGESSDITVFIRNEKGVGIANKVVTLNVSSGTYSPTEVTTNKSGKAEFKLTAPAGQVSFTAQTDNITVGQPLELTFQ